MSFEYWFRSAWGSVTIGNIGEMFLLCFDEELHTVIQFWKLKLCMHRIPSVPYGPFPLNHSFLFFSLPHSLSCAQISMQGFNNPVGVRHMPIQEVKLLDTSGRPKIFL